MSLTFESQNGTPETSIEETVNIADETTVDETSATTVETQPIAASAKLPSLKDLPQLGSSFAFANTKVNWGPNVKPDATQNSSASMAPSLSLSVSASKPMRSSTVQVAFTLDLQSQLSITKLEYSRIIQSVKQNHQVSLESTISKSSRTFLISGRRDDVEAAKRELVKKMTRPIDETMEIPSNCRAAIIGSGGKTIREISDAFEVKIFVSREVNEDSYDEELNDSLSNVTLHGDVASVNLAKQRIMDIVKEETKNAVARLNIDNDKIAEFVDMSEFTNKNSDSMKVQYFEKSGDIVISGLREEVKSVKEQILNYLQNLNNDMIQESVKIPVKFQLLIDANKIKEKFNVIVQFPTEPTDEIVSFVGQRNKVTEAMSFARSASKKFSVDSLDISKSHSKNLEHARSLALYFQKYDVLSQIKADYPEVNIHLPSPKTLLASKDVVINITADVEHAGEIKNVRKELISFVNNITPLDTLTIDDLDYDLFNRDIKHILLGQEEKAAFVQLGDFFTNNDSVILYALSSNEDFKPSAEEVLESLTEVNTTLDLLRQKQNSLESFTFDMEDDVQDTLLSKGSATLNIMLDDVSKEDGNIQVKLHKPEKNQLLIRGNEKAVKLVKKALINLIDSPSKSVLVFEVPANTISRLVGNKGSNLQQICENFDCNVDVPNHEENTSKDAIAEVTLTGLEYNIEHAKVYILAEAKKWADITTKELIVPVKFHRNMIGSQGFYRNRLQDKYNVRVMFPKTGDVVTIRGPSRGVNKAFDELKALLDFETENGYKTIINVPVDQVPVVIGKSGETINDIRADFGVELDFLQKASDEKSIASGVVELEITGSRSAIKEATQKVEAIVSEVSDNVSKSLDVERKFHRFIVGSGGQNLRTIISKAGGDEIRKKSVQIPNADSEESVIVVQGPKKFVAAVAAEIEKTVNDIKKRVTKELEILKERQGALIGPGGIVRQQLESEFNVILDVPNKGETGNVKITGLEDDIEKAIKKINTEIIRDDFDIEIQVPAAVHEFVSERGAFIQKLRFDQSISVRHGNGTRRATKLSRTELTIPVEKATGDAATEKVKVTIEEVGLPNSEESGDIPWRLNYEPIDLSNILGEDEGTPKKKKEENSEAKKQEALSAVAKLIEERITMAPNATYAAFVWCSDPKKFNKIVGPGGSNVKKIREATGTIINVPRRSDKVNDIVYIRGTKEGVEKASKLISKSLN